MERKVYLVGYYYDDFSAEGFRVFAVASTLEKAREIRDLYNTDREEELFGIQEYILNKAKDLEDNSVYYPSEFEIK